VPGRYWVINDGPNTKDSVGDPVLYQIDLTGNIHRTVRLSAPNRDWEDISSFLDNGRRYLLVADTGDNRARHADYSLHLIDESGETDQEATPMRTIRFRFPHGPLDCEAVAVDVPSRSIFLLGKREEPAGVYRLPLDSDTQSAHVAERVGELPALEKASLWERITNPWQGPYASQPTALDISPDGRRVAVLTYKNAYIWRRTGVTLVDGEPLTIALPIIGQWEAISFDRESVVIGREGASSLLQYAVGE
jgi:hypothetical protein